MAGIHLFHKQTFHKQERLCNHNQVNTIFTQGRHFTIYPIKINWMIGAADQPVPAQVVVQIQRKHIRHAVKRNLMKRRIREAYRKHKGILYDHLERQDGKLNIALIYYGNSILPYRELEPIIILILQRLIREYDKSTG